MTWFKLKKTPKTPERAVEAEFRVSYYVVSAVPIDSSNIDQEIENYASIESVGEGEEAKTEGLTFRSYEGACLTQEDLRKNLKQRIESGEIEVMKKPSHCCPNVA